MQPEIIIGNYQELKNDCNLIRYRVFVQEQNVPKNLELDERDPFCTHVILKLNKNSIGTGRIDLAKEGKIGRLAILPSFRKQGYGKLILRALENIGRKNGLDSVWLNAQKKSVNFYFKYNYIIISNEFLEADLVHVKMLKQLTISNKDEIDDGQ